MQKTNFWARFMIWNILIWTAAVLIGCRALNDAPISHLYVIDTDHQVCSKRIIVDKNTLASKWVEDMPIEKCDGIVGLSAQEFLNLRTFMKGK